MIADPAARPPAPLHPALPHGTVIRFWQVPRTVDPMVADSSELEAVVKLVTPYERSEDAWPDTLDDRPAATVLEMATYLRSEPDSVQRAFRRCLALTEEIHRASIGVSEARVQPITSGDAGLVSIVAQHRDGTWDEAGLSIYLLEANVDRFVAEPFGDVSQIEAFEHVLARGQMGDPFRLADSRRAQAVASFAQGEFGDAVLHAAISIEVLLDGLLGLLLWEDRMEAGDAAKILELPFAKKLRTQYHPRLQGSWDQAGNDVIRRVNLDLLWVRGRVVHRGHRPSEETAAQALRAGSDLWGLVGDRLGERRTAYMRTALLGLGQPGLERRGLWGGQIRRWIETNPDETLERWLDDYRIWRDVVDRQIG